MTNDALSFMFSVLNSSSISSRGSVIIKNSKKSLLVLSVLYKHGYIRGYFKNQFLIKIFLKFNGSATQPVIRYIQPITVNGRYFNVTFKVLAKLAHTNETYLISTPKGVLTLKDSLKYHHGGFILCKLI